MSSADALERVIRPMQAIFAPPAHIAGDMISVALAQYAEALSAFSVEELQTAWTEVRDTHRLKTWPPISSFVAIIRSKRSHQQAMRRSAHRDEEAALPMHVWDLVRNSAVARIAAEEGWSWSLKCEIAYGGRTLEQISLVEMRAGRHDATILAAELEDRGTVRGRAFPSDMREQVIGMWRNLLFREAETATEIMRAQQLTE